MPTLPPAILCPLSRRGDNTLRRQRGRVWQPNLVRLPFAGTWYNVYGSPIVGQAIAYGGSPLAITQGTTWTTATLGPGTWSFGIRAANASGEEQNLDCAVTIALDASGNDITNCPAPPVGLRAFPLVGGSIRVEWYYPPTRGATTPTGFNVYIGTGGSPNYATPAATVAYGTGIFNTLVANLSSLTNETTYCIGVRAHNTSGEETNTTSVSVTADATGPKSVDSLTASAIV
jgi:hypothetical protein